MRFVRPFSLVLASLMMLVACGDDEETSARGSGGGSSSDASAASTGAGDATTSASGSDTTSSSSAGEGGGVGGEGGGSEGGAGGAGGAGGGEPLEVIEGPGFRSGDRLRPVYLDGGSGARQLLHWFDTELGLPCQYFEDTAAGDTYTCVPTGAGARIAFTDAACTDVVVVVSDDGCDDSFASQSTDHEVVFANTDTMMARGRRTTWERGEAIDQPAKIYALWAIDECEAGELAEGESVHQAVTPAVPLATATRELESLGDGLARAVARGEDGSVQLMGPFHEDSASVCQFLTRGTEGGGFTCAPAVIAEFASVTRYPSGLIHHSDDACSVPAASLFTSDYIVEPADYVVGPSEVEGELVAYVREEELDVAYSTHTAECAEHGSYTHHYRVGAQVDVTFPQVFFDLDVAGGRLASSTQGSASGEIAATAYGFWDTTFDTPCGPAVFDAEEGGQGPVRCVPGAQWPDPYHGLPHELGYFSDPACTLPVIEGATPTVEYDARNAPEGDGCSSPLVHHVVTRAALFEPYEGDVYEEWGNECRPHAPTTAFSRYVRDLGPEEFARLTLVDPAADAP